MTRSRYLPIRTRRALVEQETCAECGDLGPFEHDHITPIALGGDNEPDNLQKLCVSCHQTKTHGRDCPMIDKANRLRKGPRQRKGRAIRSRGFQKRATPHHWPKRKMQSREWG